jgi:sulfhydrogenase subunit beta (sulfur reductase)
MSSRMIPETTPTVLSKNSLIHWLDQIASQMRLIAPRDIAGNILYRLVNNAAEITWDYTRPVLSIKDVFFPPTEVLFTIEKIGNEVNIRETSPEGEQVLFGVRPCDAHGLQALDALFIATQPIDPYYMRRRENTILVGLGCPEMGATCFCTTMGGAPDDPRHMDLMLHAIEDVYLLDIVTEKGAFLLERYPLVVEPGIQPGTFIRPEITTERLSYPALDCWPEHFNQPYWEEIAERCLSCRACAYVCPTCRCFDVRDEFQSEQGDNKIYERIRCWDSCAGEAYRQIAGGHNPRAAKGERLRNRFYCKYYYFPQQYGPAACTGCGRCIDVCPAGVDITEILQFMAGIAMVEKQAQVEVGRV